MLLRGDSLGTIKALQAEKQVQSRVGHITDLARAQATALHSNYTVVFAYGPREKNEGVMD